MLMGTCCNTSCNTDSFGNNLDITLKLTFYLKTINTKKTGATCPGFSSKSAHIKQCFFRKFFIFSADIKLVINDLSKNLI